MIGSSTLRTAENTAMRAAKEQFEKYNEKREFRCPFLSIES